MARSVMNGDAGTRRLMVIVSDHPSEWIAKGEVIERYFNPGRLFDEVALVVTNDNAQEFAVSADTCTGVALAGQASCTMAIRFRPGATGSRAGRIVVTDPTTMSSAPCSAAWPATEASATAR